MTDLGSRATTSASLTDAEVAALRADFPILSRTVRDRPLVYLDSGATSQKPRQVIEAESRFYERHNAAVHRGAHALAEEATEEYEGARARIARFLGAVPEEVVFTRNATEAINLIAYAFSNAAAPGALADADPDVARRLRIGPGDEVVVTVLEHHANLVPWQELCRRTGAALRHLDVDEDGYLQDAAEVVTERTKVVALAHVSNVLGTRSEAAIASAVAAAHAVDALVVLDAAQSVPHLPVDVRALGVDFVAFTGHKALGPSGVGVLWGRPEVLAAMPPFLTGGSMIELVTLESSTFAAPPARFEAGVPMAAQAVGLAAAVDYLDAIGMERVEAHDRALVEHALGLLGERPWVRVLGPTDPAHRVGAVSFTVDDIHPHDVAQVLDDAGVAVRSGHHCAWPLHRRLGIPASTRASFHVYTTHEEVEAFATALDRVRTIFGTA